MFEQPLIASVLMSPEVIYDLKLKPFHFKTFEYKRIFEAMLWLAEKKTVIDPFTLSAELNEPSDKFMQFTTLLPSGANVHTYEKRVIENYKKGELQKLSPYLTDVQDISETVTFINNKMNEIVEDQNHLDQSSMIMNFTESLDYSIDCIPTPYQKLNEYLGGGLPYHELVILAARPGVGKTAMAVDFTLANMSEPNVLFISLEMSYNQLAARIMSNKLEIDSYAIKKRNPVAIQRIMSHLSELRNVIVDDTACVSLPEIRMKVKSAKREHDIKLVIIDYLGLMVTHTEGSRAEQVSAITRGLKLMAKELNICVLCLSQLNRQFSSRSDPSPILSDLRDSGSIEQDAAVVLFIHREIQSNNTELIIGKQREGETGTIKLEFQGKYTKFREAL